MIRKVTFSNFYSFNQEQEISFLAKKKKTYDYFQSKSEDQVTKIAGFVGGNASGKTNVMRVFGFLKYFVCDSSKDETAGNLNIAYKTFFNNLKPSHLGVEFEIEDSIFFYNFSIQKNTILKESLQTRKMKKGSRTVGIFMRNEKKVEKLHKDFFPNFKTKFLKNIRQDVSLIAFLKAHYDIEIVNKVYHYFESMKGNINEVGQINNPMHQFKALDLYLKEKDIKEEMENFVRHFDIGLSEFVIEKEEEEGNVKMSVQGVHNTKEGSKKLDFHYESRGTKSLFFTLANILSGLKHNNIIVIDEIESGFHPEALNKLISYFLDENKDSKAQMIFSSHSLGFMNKLDMHQIYLVEKNKENESVTYRLNQVEGVRSDENFLAKYMSGIYGAFPQIRV